MTVVVDANILIAFGLADEPLHTQANRILSEWQTAKEPLTEHWALARRKPPGFSPLWIGGFVFGFNLCFFGGHAVNSPLYTTYKPKALCGRLAVIRRVRTLTTEHRRLPHKDTLGRKMFTHAPSIVSRLAGLSVAGATPPW